MNYTLHLGNCLDTLRGMADNSVDSIVTDPPYGISFMGRKWDSDVPSVEIWAECLRVLKPGGHLLAFAGTRTQHRMAVRIEDAGFEIRDMIAWVYASGFPKSLDVSKAIEKAAGAEREVLGPNKFAQLNGQKNANCYGTSSRPDATAPATEAARQWQGWGTALKPALEPITVARKPLDGTVAANVLQHGTGALNIDGCRVATDGEKPKGSGARESWREMEGRTDRQAHGENVTPDAGRWPANICHDGSEEVVAGFPVTGASKASMRGIGLTDAAEKVYGNGNPDFDSVRGHNDNGGSAARFFYCAKASKRDRDEGLEGFEEKRTGGMRATADGSMLTGSGNERTTTGANIHPTVKPTDLMAYLVRLVTPPGGVVLDPFMGSGSTGKAAMREGFDFVGCEMSPEYLEIARARIEAARTRADETSGPKPVQKPKPKPQPVAQGQNDLFEAAA